MAVEAARHPRPRAYLSPRRLLGRFPSLPVVKKRFTWEFERISEAYEIEDMPKVREYLRWHMDAIDVLLEAISVIPRYFPRSQNPIIRYRPNEDALRFPYLSVLIPVSDAYHDVRDRMDRFDEEWWLCRFPVVFDELIFDVEYRPRGSV